MRSDQYSRWVDPAPLEVERPRLPWWTMLPRKLLLAVSPIILVAIVATVVVFCARRVWRYPLFVVGGVVLVGLGVGYSWWAPVKLLAVLGIGCGLWAWQHPDSFTRTVVRQVRSEWRRAVVYAWPWRRVMLFSELTKRTGHAQHRMHYPRIRRVRCDGWRDRVSIKLLHGQCAATYAAHAEELANSFGAHSCRIRVDKPRRIWLDLIHTDPLAVPLVVPALAEPGTGVDLTRVVIGRTETGRPWLLRLLGRHILIAGVSDAGKSSVMWAVLRALAPWIRSGLAQVFGIDPKGGMELGRAPGLFQQLVCTNGTDAVELLEHVAILTRHRAEALRKQGARKWSSASGQPFVLLIVDELADVIAYQPDNALRKRANVALQSILSQGRAPGVCVIGQLQDPRKAIIDFRHLFPIKIAMRLDEPEQVDMVLDDGVRQRGATAHEISEDTPGVAWAKIDSRREPQRARAFHTTDTDLDELSTYVTAGRRAAPRQLARTDAA
ncbi:MAG TPA: FtsK/SpoIIIE domain-containing protein [Pseudonocardiaceae bacterium]|jgi:S-DNA-T family DNA segregation ATPase FtsK/SpoIIIE|nr:FtsK/SpoIIIE domain-containing protein [Pseudonocardiaceae bacterium]